MRISSSIRFPASNIIPFFLMVINTALWVSQAASGPDLQTTARSDVGQKKNTPPANLNQQYDAQNPMESLPNSARALKKN
jgi:hypothetical protein